MKCSESVRVLKQRHLLHLKTLDNSFYRTVYCGGFFWCLKDSCLIYLNSILVEDVIPLTQSSNSFHKLVMA